jgi:hypothetical protein
MSISWRTAIENARASDARLPSKTESRFSPAFGMFPKVSPTFKIEPVETVFTIGSCFARNIEEKLLDFNLPTRQFVAPVEEWPARPNGLLNEFNPGTMNQRIVAALDGCGFGSLAVAEAGSSGGMIDLLLVPAAPVSKERLLERRAEIDAVYAQLPKSQVVIITLGYVEAWFDNETSLYLNQMPPLRAFRRSEGRYEVRILDVEEAYPLLEAAIGKMVEVGMRKILLTVSPVPLNATFSGMDCVVANGFSKAVLRVCADQLRRRFPEVDYFPSYEIVTSGGHLNFLEDNTHVCDDLVGAVVDHMLEAYKS